MAKGKTKHTQERILWLDFVRIIAIFLVVFTHSLGSQHWAVMTNPSDWVVHDLYDSLLRICVPLFVMVSGALLLTKVEPYNIFFGKRITKIIFPWALWTIIYMLWNIAFNNADISSFSAFLKTFYVTFMSQFWFLPMIAGIYLLTPTLRLWLKHAQKFDVSYALLLWFVVFSIVPFIHKLAVPGYPIPVPFVLEHIGYFLLGYAIIRWVDFSKRTGLLLMVFILSVIGNSVGTFIAYGLARPELRSYFWNNMSFFIIFATISGYMLIRNLMASTPIDKASKRFKLIVTLSNASFGIFLVHVLIIEAMKHVPAPFPIPYPLASPLFAVIVYVMSLGIIVLIQKTPLKRFLAT